MLRMEQPSEEDFWGVDFRLQVTEKSESVQLIFTHTKDLEVQFAGEEQDF